MHGRTHFLFSFRWPHYFASSLRPNSLLWYSELCVAPRYQRRPRHHVRSVPASHLRELHHPTWPTCMSLLCLPRISCVALQVKNILRYLFPVPKDDSKRVVTFANQSDFISFRYSSFSSLPEYSAYLFQTSRLRKARERHSAEGSWPTLRVAPVPDQARHR